MRKFLFSSCLSPSFLVVLLLSFLIAGCGSATRPSFAPAQAAGLHGRVVGGQQPVAGATIQLYAAPGYYSGFASTPLLTTPVSSDAAGNWSITGDYTCPAGDPLVYIVATGGNPGLGSGTNNHAINLMAVLSDCNSLTSATFINLNEVTTVAAVFSLAPYITDDLHLAQNYPGSLGYPSNLYNQFATAQQFANTTTGTSPGPSLPATASFSLPTLYTLADIIASCVNTIGGVANDGSPCGTLFGAATPASGVAPTDTIGALINIANNPTQSVSQLFGLLTPGAPFQPSLGAAPASWNLAISNLQSLQTISLNSSLQVATTLNVLAFATYNNAVDVNVSNQVSWSTSNAGIATVSSTGAVTGLTPGTVTITATLLGVHASTTLTVLAPLTSLSLSPSPGSVYLNQSIQYTLTGTYANGVTGPVVGATFSSSNSNIASINSSGIATGAALGQVTITATVGSVSTTAPLTVATAPVILYPLLTSFTVNSCSYNPIIFGNCLFSFTAINLTPGTSYYVSDDTHQVCSGTTVGGCVVFVFTATASTYNSPPVAPNNYCGLTDVYGNVQPPPNICGGLSNGYQNLSGAHDLAVMSVYRNPQDGPPLGYTTDFLATPFTWP